MLPKYFLLLLTLLLSYSSFAQFFGEKQAPLRFAERGILGTSLTYIPNQAERGAPVYHELTWHKNIAVNITPSLYVGLSYLSLYTFGSSIRRNNDRANYFLFGSFVQYDFLPKNKSRFFLESSWHRGNYCTCGVEDPYKREGLNYISLGFGFEFPLKYNFSLEVGGASYQILDSIRIKYTYTQYVAGINYNFGQ